MGLGDEVKTHLKLLLPGWVFITVDNMDRSRGLATSWNSHKIQFLNTWGLDFGLGITVLIPELKEVVHILNIYRPYKNKKPFWDSLLTKSFFKELLILGGDLNLSLRPSEVWGDSVRPDQLADYFCHKFAESRLTDLDPLNLKPTWKNNRVRIEGLTKRLNQFLINDSLLNNLLTIKQWIGFGGLLDHHPIFLEFRQGFEKPTNPFKFNKNWLEDDSFLELIKDHWIPFRQDSPQSTTFQFTENMKRIKEVVKPWDFQKRKNEEKEL
jgi:hypothetical protein